MSSDSEDVDEDPAAGVNVELGLANPPSSLSGWREGASSPVLILVVPPRKDLSRIQTERGPTIQNALNDFATVSAPRDIMKEN